MSAITLLPDMLHHGYNTCAKSTLITAILIISFILSSFFLIRLHRKLFNKKITGKKKFLKIAPFFCLLIFILILIWYFTNKGLGYDQKVWQSDFFVAYFINLSILLVFTPIYLSTVKLADGTKITKTRRKWKQYLINGTFKISFFLFWAFSLTPYYVYLVSFEEFIIWGPHAIASLLLFIAFCFICYFSFGKSPFAPLLPSIVFWGASTSYYSWSFAMSYAIWLNFSAPSLIMAGVLFGFGFLSFLDPILKGAKALWAMLYIWLLGVIMIFFWIFLWWFYGYGQGGTGYEEFYFSSFIGCCKRKGD